MRDIADQLEKEPIHLSFEYEGKSYEGEAVSISETCSGDLCYEADVSLNDEDLGIIRCAKSGWNVDRMEQGLIDAIGNEILLYYE